jgi:RimJ/RimL family protein N-acetyltransferase
MRNPFCSSARLYLRALEPADAPLLAACNNDPEVRQSFFTHTPTSLHAQEEAIRGFYHEGASYLPFAVCLKADDTPMGVTAWHRIDRVSRAAVFSICLCHGQHRGHGYGREATELMMAMAFDVMNLHRVHLHVWADNHAALRTYEQCGFVREGLLREAMMHHGQWCDFVVMGLLEHEWRQRQHPA